MALVVRVMYAVTVAGSDVGRPGGVCASVQAASYQARLHAGGRRSGAGYSVRQRLLTDDDLSL